MKANEIATKFVQAAQAHGFAFEVKSPTEVSVSRSFTPGDAEAFNDCESHGPGLLSMLGARGGMWGSDPMGIGGVVALRNGRYVLTATEIPKRVVTALSKMTLGGGLGYAVV